MKMNEHQALKVEAAIRIAFKRAIDSVGMANFKASSLFLSNERSAQALKKAA
jgi:hypothetical protein